MSAIQRTRPWLLPIGLMACVVVILMPLPSVALDLLLAGNIALAVVIFLNAIQVRSPLEFNVFPTILLATTLSRLVLNLATTRTILTRAPIDGESAAGGVIQTFGRFVAGNQIEVGLILFVILVVVQFVVITKGATRISEVAARFALDAMPGRQSAIDADLNAGHIDAETAADRRDKLVTEADFYAAMDGAGKFVRGDAIAGLVITMINLIGGLYLGLFVYSMGLGESAAVFSKLTIGDGLVSQIPSLLISLAAGILVTRGTRASDLSDNFITQLFGNTRALVVTGIFLLALMVTGLPLIPLLLLGSGALLLASSLSRSQKAQDAEARLKRERESAAAPQKRVEDFLNVDPLEVAIGFGLLPLADPSRGGDLMPRIASLRNQMAADIGIVLPKVRVRDDASLGQQEFEIRLFGDFVAGGEIPVDKLLAVGDSSATGTPAGIPVEIPSESGQHAVWIEPSGREQAMIYGYKTRTGPAVLADRLESVARNYADELLSHDATKHLLDELREVAPTMVDHLVPQRIEIGEIQKVLQGLLAEGIAIRQLAIIVEALGDVTAIEPRGQHDWEGSGVSQDERTVLRIEHVRKRLSRTICAPLRDDSRCLRAVAISPEMCDQIGARSQAMSFTGGGVSEGQGSGPKTEDFTCDAIRQAVKTLREDGFPPVVLVPPNHRRAIKQLFDREELFAHVLASDEVSVDTRLQLSRVIDTAVSAAAA
ncbi:MAG: flagellar biosynthesis protein FlhA [Planctomycetota bacterium]